MARRPAPGTRDRILRVASGLFQRHGVRAIGLQQVIDETGLGKSLLYREFSSKDELVGAWLRASDAAWWTKVEAELRRHDGDPARQMLAIVELTLEIARSPDFHGCVFYNTASEFRDAEHPGRREARAHLERMRERLRSLARAAGAEAPEELADALMLLMGGVYVSTSVLGPTGPAAAALASARTLIEAHCQAPAGDSRLPR
ncbi:TetR/AcrR family transcriptional regulator [Spirillospora sp. NPDC048819]|uniref:TetR/AcrR family transcriptional regulator n=1 Tax=Spirillospora sp. NPDC048819 TaxID=3155268 RepID=UPI0033F3B2D9